MVCGIMFMWSFGPLYMELQRRSVTVEQLWMCYRLSSPIENFLWDLITNYKWAYNPMHSRSTPIISRVISPLYVVFKAHEPSGRNNGEPAKQMVLVVASR